MAKKEQRKQINIKDQLKNVNVGIKDGVFIYAGNITLAEFCKKININPNTIIKKAFLEGKSLTLNTTLTEEFIGELCIEHGLDFQKEVEVDETNILEELKIKDEEKDLEQRPPIITIMGHVDHGKTTLLDTIRKTNVVMKEVGGITQHIGAYQVKHKEKYISFLDTPGHEAFTKMRAQGSLITDIIIIVVSAVDGIKVQTLEAKDHALASKKPIIVAINKIDLPGANAEEIKTKLSEHGLVPEEWGGNVIYKEISALKGDGITQLLDTILAVAEIEDLKANPNRFAVGVVLESKLEKSLGHVATVVVLNGSLKVSDPIVIGNTFGKVRTMEDANGQKIKIAKPSMPVKITGLNSMPEVGVKFMAFGNEKEAKKIAKARNINFTLNARLHSKGKTMDDLTKELSESGIKTLNIILKTDVSGSIPAIKYVLDKINIENTKINLVSSTTGIISKSDVMLAKATGAEIYAFGIRPSSSIREIAKQEGIIINTYNIIYKMQEGIEAKLKGFLDPVMQETITGTSTVIALFKIPKIGTIGGSKVEKGKILRKNKIRLLRDGVEIYNGKITSMKITTNDAKEARAGQEVGIGLHNFNDVKIGDVFEGYEIVEVVANEFGKNPK